MIPLVHISVMVVCLVVQDGDKRQYCLCWELEKIQMFSCVGGMKVWTSGSGSRCYHNLPTIVTFILPVTVIVACL